MSLLRVIWLCVHLVVTPIVIIWALNTLFKLEIPINITTWCAMYFILSFFNSKFYEYGK